jgi:hypothetical protein
MQIPEPVKTWLEHNPRKALFAGIGFLFGLLVATVGFAATLVALAFAAAGM